VNTITDQPNDVRVIGRGRGSGCLVVTQERGVCPDIDRELFFCVRSRDRSLVCGAESLAGGLMRLRQRR